MHIRFTRNKIIFSIVWLLGAYSGFAQQDYYWVGGSGFWSDYANHWATSSGGRQFHTSVPTRDSNVFFDENSFRQPDEKVRIDCLAECHSFADTAALSYRLNIQTTLSIHHDFLLNSSTDLIGGTIFLMERMEDY